MFECLMFDLAVPFFLLGVEGSPTEVIEVSIATRAKKVGQ